jgi:hypothetical protein
MQRYIDSEENGIALKNQMDVQNFCIDPDNLGFLFCDAIPIECKVQKRRERGRMICTGRTLNTIATNRSLPLLCPAPLLDQITPPSFLQTLPYFVFSLISSLPS